MDIREQLIAEERDDISTHGQTSWVASGINLQEQQYVNTNISYLLSSQFCSGWPSDTNSGHMGRTPPVMRFLPLVTSGIVFKRSLIHLSIKPILSFSTNRARMILKCHPWAITISLTMWMICTMWMIWPTLAIIILHTLLVQTIHPIFSPPFLMSLRTRLSTQRNILFFSLPLLDGIGVLVTVYNLWLSRRRSCVMLRPIGLYIKSGSLLALSLLFTVLRFDMRQHRIQKHVPGMHYTVWIKLSMNMPVFIAWPAMPLGKYDRHILEHRNFLSFSQKTFV